MRSFYISRLLILAAFILGCCGSSVAQTSTFSYTGGMQTYIVPSGVSFISIDAQGASGGLSYYTTYGKVGGGGRVQTLMAVTPGQVFNIFVGGAGLNNTSTSPVSGGYNGGGNSNSYGGGGGGGTDMRLGGTALSNRVLVAGGGGGAAYNCSSGMDGGAGGGAIGQNGWSCGSQYYSSGNCYSPSGGTQTAAGSQGTCGGGTAAGFGFGGNGTGYGAGGGGGWYGGGGGYYAGGGGGSSYPSGPGANFPGLVHTQGYNTGGNGVLYITPDPGPATGYSAFGYTGGIQTYTVPTGTSYVNIDMNGAAGGNSPYGAGGCGGRLRCVLAVTAGQVYYIFNGGRGTDGNSSSTVRAGGFNGGGNTYAYPYGGGGGGATDIRFGGTALSNRILVSGGGGGGGYNCSNGGNQGGGGGGLTGETGWVCSSQAYSGMCYNPTGGTQSGTGANGTCNSNTAPSNNVGGYSMYYGGGGGGGYYGGGGGYYAGGAGGSSYATTSGTSGVLHSQGYNCGNDGYTIISPAVNASTMQSFSYTGAMTTFTVPTGITLLGVETDGAAGGTGIYGAGGCGGVVTCTLAVTPGQVFYVNVGGKGQNYTSSSTSLSGGYNGGGSTGSYPYQGSGGGASDIRTGGTALTNRVVVGGGGGGGGYNCSNGMQGGKGGGLTGEAGYTCGSNSPAPSCQIPSGGSQTTAGQNATCYGGSASFGVGGTGQYYGAAGGGGWYGGGGGYYCGGAGGSSYVIPTGSTGILNLQGGNCNNNGVVYLTPICTAGPISGVLATCTTGTTQLTDPTTGGAWSSSNTAVATVNSSTGLVSGVSAGTATISYGGTFACGTVYTTVVVNITAPPTPITGGSYICQSVVTTFSSTPGGTWSTSNTALATVNTIGGDVTGVSAGTVTLSYAIGSCLVTSTMPVNPTAPITGPGTVCSSYTITLSDAITPGTWTTANSTVATVDPVTGIVTGVNSGNPIITYTVGTGCQRVYGMTVNPLPAAFTGSSSVCVGLSTVLSESSTGGTWSSAATSIANVGSLSSTTASVFGGTAGTTTISYTLPTGCYLNLTFTTNPLPAAIQAPILGSCITNSDNPAITLSDATTPGTWTSSNSAVATINSTSGLLTSLIPGTTIITYTLTTGCLGTKVLSVNALPAAVTGTKVVCQNAVTYLNDASIGGVWSSSNTLMATVGSGTGIVAGVGAGNPIISYKMATGCLGLATMTVNPAPLATAPATICVGATTTLTNASPGGPVTWASSNPGFASINATTGLTTGVGAGNPVITYTLPGTSCFGTTTLTVNPAPAPITGPAAVCSGSSITLADASAPSGTWSTSATVASVTSGGLVSAISGLTTPTTAVINYSLASTGCMTSQTITINAQPTLYTLSISGKNDYCTGGAGIDIKLNSSTSGVNYELFNGSTSKGILVGSGSALTYSGMTASGAYTAIATYPGVGGCSRLMSGSPTIVIDALPIAQTLGTATGATQYCSGTGAGLHITLSGSEPSVKYYVKNLTYGTVDSVMGSGSVVDFGKNFTKGNYIAYAVNTVTGCTSNMSGYLTLTENLPPNIYSMFVSDSGFYCANGLGVHIGLNPSATGINYSLYNVTSSPVLAKTLAGTGASIDFGGNYKVGNYLVIADNATTHCSDTMTGLVHVLTHAIPDSTYLLTAKTAGFCTGGAGDTVSLGNSDATASYQLILNGTTLIDSPIAGTGARLSFGPQYLGGIYSVFAKTTGTTCGVAMKSKTNITVYPSLTVGKVTLENNGEFCQGGAGVHVSLDTTTAGVIYEVYKAGGSAPIMPAMAGTGGPITFTTPDNTAGATMVLATSLSSGGCQAWMNGSPVVKINGLPAANAVTVDNGGYFCSGGTGVHIRLAFSDVGVNYQLYKNGVALGTARTGSNSSIDFGAFTDPAIYTVVGTNVLTTCTNNMSGSANVVISTKPAAYNVTGGGSYCAGTTIGKKIGLFSSDAGIDYQLYNGTTQVGTPVHGTGIALDFGNQLATGSYSVLATNATSGCTMNMTGSRVISIDALPAAFNVTGSGSFCAGGTGIDLGLDNSVTGVSYQLFVGTKSIGTAMAGTTGSALDFGNQTTGGSYTVVATTTVSGCTNNMNGAATVIVNALPRIDTVKGGGGYCVGDLGADVYMSNAQAGVLYQLFNGSVGGSSILGMGGKLDLGLQTIGTYTGVATNAATGCSSNMVGSVTVVQNPLPSAYAVTGGGTMCAGATGFHMYLSGSQTGTSYSLFNGGTKPDTIVSGTGGALDFGAQTGNGAYMVVANNTTTGCASNMNGTGNIVVNPLPTPFVMSAGAHYCETGTGVLVSLSGSQNNVNYQLYSAGTPVGTPVGGTGAGIAFGLQTGGTYDVIGTDNTTSCAGPMTGATVIVSDKRGTPTVTIDSANSGVACIGEKITFVATPFLGGTAPTYTWKVNGLVVGSGSTYAAIPATGDLVAVEMTSNATCIYTNKAGSSITMTSVPYSTPTAATTIAPGTNICHGTPVTLNATTSFDGPTPIYSWLRNGKFVGSGKTYTYTPTAGNDKDVIVFLLRSDYHCRTADTVFSDPTVMTVDTNITPVFDIKMAFGPSSDKVGVGQIDTFTATVKSDPKYTYAYQWYVQGTAVPGANNTVYIDHSTYNNDVVSCSVTKSGACGSQSATEKTTVIMKNLGTQIIVTTGEISILPNPNKGEFTVKGTLELTTDQEVSLELTNMLGQAVYKNNVMTRGGNINEHVKLSNTLANGMYLLNVRAGNTSNVFHVVIEQ